MKKLFLLLVLLAIFSSCNTKKSSKIELHSYITNDDEGLIYWYLYYGQNNSVYYYNSRFPLTDVLDIAWNISDSAPTALNGAKELPVTEAEINEEVTEESESEADSESDSEADSSSDSDSSSDAGDSGGGDGGGDGGGE